MGGCGGRWRRQDALTRRVSGLDTLRERGLITVKTLRVAFSLYFFIGSHCNKIPSASPPRTIFPLLYLLSSIRSIHQHSCSPCSLSSEEHMHRARLASTGHGGQPQSQLAPNDSTFASAPLPETIQIVRHAKAVLLRSYILFSTRLPAIWLANTTALRSTKSALRPTVITIWRQT